MSKSIFNIAAHSDPGRERDYQEDRYIICADLDAPEWSEAGRAQFSPGGRGTLLVVADGMGGLNAGEVASRLAIEGVMDYFSKQQTAGNTPEYILTRCISHANDRIIQHATKNKDTEGMGTTLVIAWIIGNTVYVGWSGDSRCYLVREDNIRQINWDHSYVQELVSSGQISAEDAFYHPNKNIITQSLGDVGRAPDPSTEKATLLPGDRLLLCSDGLNTMLHDPEIAQLLATGDPKRCAHDLVDAANAAGGYDNITVVVAEVVDVESAQLPVDYAPEHWGGTLKPGRVAPVDSVPLGIGKKWPPWIMGMLSATLILVIAAVGYLLYQSGDSKKKEPIPPINQEPGTVPQPNVPSPITVQSPPVRPEPSPNVRPDKTPTAETKTPTDPEKDRRKKEIEGILKNAALSSDGDCKTTFDAVANRVMAFDGKPLSELKLAISSMQGEIRKCGDYPAVLQALNLSESKMSEIKDQEKK